jgi:type III secretory pathway component EscS
MMATSTALLTSGLNSLVNIFQSFLGIALTNWLPIVIVISVIGLAIGLVYGAIRGMFKGGRH